MDQDALLHWSVPRGFWDTFPLASKKLALIRNCVLCSASVGVSRNVKHADAAPEVLDQMLVSNTQSD